MTGEQKISPSNNDRTTNDRQTILYWPLVAVTLAGMVTAAYLSSLHFTADKACGDSGSCSEVLASPWAAIGGIPVAALGIGMFLAMTWFAILVLQSPGQKRLYAPWLLGISTLGVLASAWLTILQAFFIRHWCPFCLLSAGLTVVCFLLIAADCRRTPNSLKPAFRQPSFLLRGLPAALIALLLPTLLIFSTGRFYEEENGADNGENETPVIGVIDEREYRLHDVDRAVSVQMQQIETQRYNIRKSYLETELIRREAAIRKVSAEELYKKEVLQEIKIGRDEVAKFLAENYPKATSKEQAKLLPEVIRTLRKQKLPEVQRAFIDRLAAKHHASFSIPLPDRIAIQANPRKGAIHGPEGAAITIVEFSDFQCPFCGKAHAALKSLAERYPEKVRLAFRHFPLNQHQVARRASEIAACMQQQGLFWPYADFLFENQRDLSDETMLDYAEKLNADMNRLDGCLKNGIGKKAVAMDIAEGRQIGIQSTPSLFINGRFFIGLPGDLDGVIEEELAQQQQQSEQPE